MKKTIITSVLVIFATSAIILSCKKETPAPVTNTPTNPYGAGNGKVTFYTLNNVPNGVDWTINFSSLHDGLVWNGTPNCDQTGTTSIILPAGTYAYHGQQTNGSYTWSGNVTVASGQCVEQPYTYSGVSTFSVTVNFYTMVCTTINTHGHWNVYVDGQFAGTVNACTTAAPSSCTSTTTSQILSVLLSTGTHTWYATTPTVSGTFGTAGTASSPNQLNLTGTSSCQFVSF